MSDNTILIPEFLQAEQQDSFAVLAAACTFICETSCEPDYEGCGTCQICQDSCQKACQSGQCGTCQTSQGPTYIAATFSVTATTSKGATIYVTLGSGYSQFRIFVRLTSDANSVVYDQTVTRTSSFSYSISGLSPSTNYTINVCSVATSQSEWATARTFTTNAGVAQWSWTTSNGSASAIQTVAMYNAINGTRQLDGLSFLVWNDLCDKVNETAVTAGDSWLTSWGTLSATKMSSSSKALTAQRFNALKNNIGARISTGVQDAGIDSPIYWENFLTLATKLNAWISRI